MNVTIYDKTTGEILRVCSLPEDRIQDQLSSNEEYIEGTYDDQFWYIENKVPIKKLPCPSLNHCFDYIQKKWIHRLTKTEQWNLVKAERNRLLSQSDWTQLPDVPLATQNKWKVYRQALRDVTMQSDPYEIVWPVRP